MLTSTQQFAARFETLTALVRAVAPIADCEAKAHCIRTIVTPAFSGAFALPNFTTVRPSYNDAQRYAERLINRAMDANSAYCVYVDPNPEWGGAVDVGVAFGAEVYVVTVWLEDGLLYGEW